MFSAESCRVVGTVVFVIVSVSFAFTKADRARIQIWKTADKVGEQCQDRSTYQNKRRWVWEASAENEWVPSRGGLHVGPATCEFGPGREGRAALFADLGCCAKPWA